MSPKPIFCHSLDHITRRRKAMFGHNPALCRVRFLLTKLLDARCLYRSPLPLPHPALKTPVWTLNAGETVAKAFIVSLSKYGGKRWQLALHCRLRQSVPPIVLGFNHEALRRPQCTSVSNFTKIGQCVAELFVFQQSFSAHFHAPNQPSSQKYADRTTPNLEKTSSYIPW